MEAGPRHRVYPRSKDDGLPGEKSHDFQVILTNSYLRFPSPGAALVAQEGLQVMGKRFSQEQFWEFHY